MAPIEIPIDKNIEFLFDGEVCERFVAKFGFIKRKEDYFFKDESYSLRQAFKQCVHKLSDCHLNFWQLERL
jgi:hypothetical protein